MKSVERKSRCVTIVMGMVGCIKVANVVTAREKESLLQHQAAIRVVETVGSSSNNQELEVRWATLL